MAKTKTKTKTLKGFAATQALAQWFDRNWPDGRGCGVAGAARTLIHKAVEKEIPIEKLWRVAAKDDHADHFLQRLSGSNERTQAEEDICFVDSILDSLGYIEGTDVRHLIKATKALRVIVQSKIDRQPKLVGIRKTRRGIVGVWQ
jgi:hypothetical protein